MPNIIYSWTFSSIKKRWAMWYSIVLSIIIWLVIWGFLSKMYAMSFVILLLTGLTYFVENNSEDIINVNITELGIRVWSWFYDFSSISSYTFIYEGEKAIILRLNLNRKGLRSIDLNIENKIAIDLKNILVNFSQENPQKSLSFTDKIIRLLKL